MNGRSLPRLLLIAAAVAAAVLSGCSGRHQVSGRVTYEDGAPVEGGTVIGEATVDGKVVGVQGNIEPDGRFNWGGERAGDGALPGDYKVLVMPVALGDSEMAEGKRPAVDGKYGRYESSGLTFTVKPERNEFNITVSRPKPKGN